MVTYDVVDWQGRSDISGYSGAKTIPLTQSSSLVVSPSGKARSLGVPHLLTGPAAGTLATADYITPIQVVMIFQPVASVSTTDVNRVVGSVMVKRTYKLVGRTAS
jgi:hypothetical protein